VNHNSSILPEMFPFFFIGMWLFVSTLLSFLSGWFFLMKKFPDVSDRGEKIKSYSPMGVSMGIGVHFQGVLTLESYPQGLRLKMFRLFGPFNQPIFVPWNQIEVERARQFFMKRAVLYLGERGAFSKLVLTEDLANRLWQDMGASWPEKGSMPDTQSSRQIIYKILLRWLGMTLLASSFFILAPRLMTPQGNSNSYPSILVAVLFPAIVFGIVYCLDAYNKLRENVKRKDE